MSREPVFKLYAKIWGEKPLYRVSGGFIYTYIGFGVIDRGTNVLQIRPTTLCPLNCIFCSVDAGPYSIHRWAEFNVDLNTMLITVREIAEYKGGGVEALIDTIGEGLTYPNILDLIDGLRRTSSISSIALETHGALLNKKIIDKLNEHGLDRVNLSIDTLDKAKARYLQGVEWYDVDRVREMAEYIVRETNIDLHITPLWIPGVNDEDVVKVVEWAYRIGAGKRWPPATIQKYNLHKYGRRVKGVKPLSWSDFWSWIRMFEEKYGYRVSWSMDEWGMSRRRKYPCNHRVNEDVVVKIVSRGVFRGEYIGAIVDENTLITVYGGKLGINNHYVVKIIEDKDCLLIGKPVRRIRI